MIELLDKVTRGEVFSDAELDALRELPAISEVTVGERLIAGEGWRVLEVAMSYPSEGPKASLVERAAS